MPRKRHVNASSTSSPQRPGRSQNNGEPRIDFRSYDDNWHFLSFPVARLTAASLRSHQEWKSTARRRRQQQTAYARQLRNASFVTRPHKRLWRVLRKLGFRVKEGAMMEALKSLVTEEVELENGDFEAILDESELLVEVETQYLACFIGKDRSRLTANGEGGDGKAAAYDTMLSFTSHWQTPPALATRAGKEKAASHVHHESDQYAAHVDDLHERLGDLSISLATWLRTSTRRWALRARTRRAREHPREVFDVAADALRQPISLVRKPDAMWLLHAILEQCVEEIGPVATVYRHKIGNYSAKLHDPDADFDPSDIRAVTSIQRELLYLQRKLKPSQRVVRHLAEFEQEEGSRHAMQAALRQQMVDIEERISLALEELGSLVAMCDGVNDEFNALAQKKQNDVLYVLTVTTTCFIPMQLFTGVYGMNFVDDDGEPGQPELRWGSMGYVYFWLLVVLGGLLTFSFFKYVLRVF